MLAGYATYARRHTHKTFVTIHFSLKKVHSLNYVTEADGQQGK